MSKKKRHVGKARIKHSAKYCMIAPGEDSLFDPHNSISGSGS